MSKFVRPAGWLRHLFTQSQTTQVNPTEVSDDVSLIQPYDGGGFPLFDPGQWGLFVTSLVGAATNTVIIIVPDNKVVRLLGLGTFLAAGTVGTAHFTVLPTSGVEVPITPQIAVHATQLTGYPIYCPILGPGHTLRSNFFGGGAASQIRYDMYYVEAPLGTVFYL